MEKTPIFTVYYQDKNAWLYDSVHLTIGEANARAAELKPNYSAVEVEDTTIAKFMGGA